MIKKFLFYGFIVMFLTSCKFLNPSLMLKTPRDYKFDELPTNKEIETRLRPNDKINMVLLANDGFKLLDLVGENRIATNQLANNLEYKVEFDGMVNFPIIDRIKLGGLTIREAESLLEEEFSKYYVKPFVLLKITNRKVMVFNGSDGNARVVSLMDDNTDLLRVIAQSGGITSMGRAYDIKVIRGEFEKPKVYHFNLRTIEGLKSADFMMQSNDIVYVTPSPQTAKKIMLEIGPYLSLLTTLLLVINYFKK